MLTHCPDEHTEAKGELRIHIQAHKGKSQKKRLKGLKVEAWCRKRERIRVLLCVGTSLAVQWLGLRASTAGGTNSIPGQGTKIPHAMQHSQKKKKESAALCYNLTKIYLHGILC